MLDYYLIVKKLKQINSHKIIILKKNFFVIFKIVFLWFGGIFVQTWKL